MDTGFACMERTGTSSSCHRSLSSLSGAPANRQGHGRTLDDLFTRKARESGWLGSHPARLAGDRTESSWVGHITEALAAMASSTHASREPPLLRRRPPDRRRRNRGVPDPAAVLRGPDPPHGSQELRAAPELANAVRQPHVLSPSGSTTPARCGGGSGRRFRRCCRPVRWPCRTPPATPDCGPAGAASRRGSHGTA